MKKNLPVAICIGISLFGLSALGLAQIGSGWSQYYPSKTIQKVGSTAYYRYDSSLGIEVFKTFSGDERCEARVNDDYYSGQRQFEGYIKYYGGNDVVVTQNFGGETGNHAYQTRAFSANNGELRRYTSSVLTTNIKQVWVRVNVIHNYDANTVTVYINGSNKGTWPGDDPNGTGAKHYHKYGVYMNSQTNPYVMWKGIKFFQKSTKSGSEPVIADSEVSLTCSDNPVVDNTVINYTLPKASFVKLAVYDLTGREIESLVNSQQVEGEYNFTWDASGKPKGTYIVRLTAGSTTKTMKMVKIN